MNLKSGQVAVITGAGSGIGRALALACAERGMRILAADIEQSAVDITASDIRDLGAEVLALEVDVSKASQVETMAEKCLQHFGACNLLCNNAGVSVSKPLAESCPRDWEWVISVNTLAVGYAIHAFLPQMRASGCAHIVNTASMAGLVPLPGFGPYVASKYAVVGMSEVLAGELAPEQIGVSVLCPGVVSTQIFNSERNRPDKAITPPLSPGTDDEAMKTDFDARYSRMLTPEEVARMVLVAVTENRLYIATHPEWSPLFEQRAKAISDAFAIESPQKPNSSGSKEDTLCP